MRILLVEDEPRLADVIARVLVQERFVVDVARDGLSGLDMALTGAYDSIILDRLLPGMDGVDVVRELRADGVGTPVLMLTALSDLPERVSGLDAGADDYLGKPFAFEELLARLRALMRRTDRDLLPERLSIGQVTIDFANRLVESGGAPVDLTPREFTLLELLARNRGRILSRDQLFERVWGPDAEPQSNVVDLYIHYLRRKLDDDPAQPSIRTVRGIGYVLEER